MGTFRNGSNRLPSRDELRRHPSARFEPHQAGLPAGRAQRPPAASYRGLSAVDGARALGWASLAIAALEIVAPKQLQRLLGTEEQPSHRGVLRVMGVRELMQGISILSERRATPELKAGVWSRVAGDALDVALLAIAARKTKRPGRFAMVAAAVAGIGLLDVIQSRRLQQQRDR